jgi:hypothetical protein
MASVTAVGEAGVPLCHVSNPTVIALYATFKKNCICLFS